MEEPEYIKDYTEKEAEEYLKFMDNVNMNKAKHECKEVTQEQQKMYIKSLADSYRECDFTYEPKSNLSILSMKNTILSMIESNPVVVIQGPTGCGKTTQIPQLILDANTKKRLHCNIIVTQPRRIAAISIAKRVSHEGGWPLGSVVGYRVGMKQEISPDTRLTYCTTEILLQRLILRKHMLDYTHVILDEIHERDQEMDFLLLVVKKLLQTNSSMVKVVLMSATVDVKRFAEYFSRRLRNKLVPAPVVEMPEKRCFEIHTYFLDEIKDLGAIPQVSPSEPRVTQSMINFCAKIIIALDEIDINDSGGNKEAKGDQTNVAVCTSHRHTVLVFLPGIYEIEELYTFLSSKCYEDKLLDLVVLHSMISSDEQQRVFYKPPARHRRIILSTNIAESSVTVPDVKYVIDFCLVKLIALDPVSNYQSLQLCWASKMSCVQRAGRAGRVMDGRVYRLVPKAFYHKVLDNEGMPEMLRAPLANVVLRAKIFDLDDPRSLLALSLDPPSLQNLSSTILQLKENGALMNDHHAFQPFDGKLTDMGRIMAQLPLHIQISKLIMMGHVFGILRDAIVLGASMALKDMFVSGECRNSISTYSTKKKWARGTDSDCIAALNVYKVWQNEKANRRFTTYQIEKQWAQRNGVQLRTLRELDVLVNEITHRLTRLGVKETVGVRKVIWEGPEREFVLQVILAGAFYPNYFVKRPLNVEAHEIDVVKNLNALDPLKTVCMRGWPVQQPGYLYARRLQEIFSRHHGIPKERIMVSFDGSARVYMQYREKETTNSDENLYRISDFVYMSVKMRHCNIPIKIDLLRAKEAQKISIDQDLDRFEKTMFFNKEKNRSKTRRDSFKIRPELPGLDITFVPLSIQNIVSPGYFWASLDDEDTRKRMCRIESALNAHPLREYRFPPKIKTVVAAPMERDDSVTYHRAIVEEYAMEIVNIFFIDHGRASRVRSSDLRVIDDVVIAKLPSLAFRCALTSVRPSNEASNFQGRWSKVSRSCFEAQIRQSEKIFGHIYSIVNSIINLELIVVDNEDRQLNMNEYLIEKGHAVSRKEGFLSKYNHELRVEPTIVNTMSPEEKSFYENQQYDDEDNLSEYPLPPEEADCNSWIQLQGPYSPLEIDMYQLTAAGKCMKTIVENESVNSIFLDENSDRSMRLLVAQNINQLNNSNQLHLRNTTLLPNVPGLAVLLALTFAPRVELRCSPLRTYYTGALCGLGPMDSCTGRGIFPDHDMEILFDVEISNDDLREINKLRHWMNVGMQLPNNAGNNRFDNDYYDDGDGNDEQMMNCQNYIKRALLELRDRRRRSQDLLEIADSNQWNRYCESFFLHAVRDVQKGEMYPLHKALKLRERNDELEDMVRRLAKLYHISNGDRRKLSNVNAYCELCEVEVYSQLNLRGHLYSQQHVKNEESLQIPNLREYYYHYV
ncbi:probable ATP-dependent RNA helicase spindle-E [Harpegnathos saltator]|uniref:Probable ATP-dependent RNA helicase spindle-E n=1 Tax=Harpegnathos saltator TaxID=610380 RepID=E2BPF8_HARSA|nr:probable ATP-dependent RNA helicase spindle-E [Harpegnathos saltator]EFN82362.1 Putative ATP-dependent RNA helicase TDRD9 [Harpegnathos saltator]